ncbi:MAG: potassium transporter TrkA [Trueperaceae bacterium]|nr:potassium transporter TrkA [Trueperaceae bacterium]
MRFIDEIALAFIALVAGSELYLKELQTRIRSIAWVTVGLVVCTFVLGSLGTLFLMNFIPFLRDLSATNQIAVSIITGTILVARSPSSAIAIINELRAKGPFTQLVLGVTVIMDVVVIIMFATNKSIALALFDDKKIELTVFGTVALELSLALLLGVLLAELIRQYLSLQTHLLIKSALTLASGYGIFLLTRATYSLTQDYFPLTLHIEPLLVCLIAGFSVTNFGRYRKDLKSLTSQVSLPIYIAFFTLVGTSLNLNILRETWLIALALFGFRLGGIMLGTFVGGVISREPALHNRVRWMGFVTQAGIALGLARETANSFPTFGPDLATLIISLVILNELVGPIFFKVSLGIVGESRVRANPNAFDGSKDVVIFGLDRQGIALANNLEAHGWKAKITGLENDQGTELATDTRFQSIKALDKISLSTINLEGADAVVCLFPSDEESLKVCEIVYEEYGTDTVVVRLVDQKNYKRFEQINVSVVDPTTAGVQLLEEYVRNPSATSLLLGLSDNQDIVELELLDPALNGIALRNLRLPLDVLVLSIRRQGTLIFAQGSTRIYLGDRITVMGAPVSTKQVNDLFLA